MLEVEVGGTRRRWARGSWTGVRSQGMRPEKSQPAPVNGFVIYSSRLRVWCRVRMAAAHGRGIRGLQEAEPRGRPQSTEKAGCSGARKGAWPGGRTGKGWACPGGRCRPNCGCGAAERSAAPWGLLSRPPQGTRLADPTWSVGFLVGVA